MSDRVFRAKGLGYALNAPQLGTSLELERLRRSGGLLKGDLIVRTTWPGAKTIDGVLYIGELNVMASTTRKSLATYLKSRIDKEHQDDLDWEGFLEEICQRVYMAERAGAPFEDTGTVDDVSDAGFLVDPMLPLGDLSSLFGDGGAGKGYFAVGIGVSVMTDRIVIPGVVPKVTGRVLYLDYEATWKRLTQRTLRVTKGIGIAPVKFRYRRCNRPLAEMVEDITREIAEHNIVLVIVDSVGMASGGQGESRGAEDSALRFFEAVRLLNTTVLGIDHISQARASGTAGGPPKPYGSIYKHNLARATWQLRQAKTRGEDWISIGLFQAKANDNEPAEPLGYLVRFDKANQTVSWTPEAINENDYGSTDTVADKIREVIQRAGHPLTPKEIGARLTGVKPGTISGTLSKSKGVFQKVGEMGWIVIDGGKDADS